MTEQTLQDRLRGSLVAGAVGDALGYPVEFISSYEGIQKLYGQWGITRLVTGEGADGKAAVSDDTQMTLFTAVGLLNAGPLGIEPKYAICRAYLEWHKTQAETKVGKGYDCWLTSLPALWHRRAPGITCLSALNAICRGQDPQNDSKGCGGVMRVAPVALYAAVDGRMDIAEADRLAGDAAALTHQHPLGFIPAALLAHVVYRLVTDELPTPQHLADYIREGVEQLHTLYPQQERDVRYMGLLAEKAIELAGNRLQDVANIGQLGEGWVGEEALAVALYCALRHLDSVEEALVAAVNHAGDSDSTGAVAGNIVGAATGYAAIPLHYRYDLELLDVILHVADDLWRGQNTPFVAAH